MRDRPCLRAHAALVCLCTWVNGCRAFIGPSWFRASSSPGHSRNGLQPGPRSTWQPDVVPIVVDSTCLAVISHAGGDDRAMKPRSKGGKRLWQRSAPEEFLVVLNQMRNCTEHELAESLGLSVEGLERDMTQAIKLVRALANRAPDQASEATAALCRTPVMDVALARMLIAACTSAENPDLALKVLGGMRQRGVCPDALIASFVMKAATQDSAWTPVVDAIKSQLACKPQGGAPRVHEGFTQVVAAAVKRRKFWGGGFLIDALLDYRMVDLFTTKLALTFFRFSKTPARSLAWISAFRAEGLIPDDELDFEVGRVYKSLKRVSDAVALLEAMVKGKRKVDDRHVGVVLSTCYAAGDWKECVRVVHRLGEWHLPLSSVHAVIVLRCLLEARRVQEAREMLERMERQGSPLDLETARLVLFSLAKQGPIESNLLFLEMMQERNVEPDLATYTAVLRACNWFNQPEAAVRVYRDMLGKGIQPDALCGATVMEALANARRWDDAFSFFDTMRAQGVQPDMKWYTQALSQVALSGRWDLFPRYLQQAVNDARARNTRLDLRFFATVINACAEANRTDEALTVLASVRSHGLVPNVYCFSAAAKSCLSRNRWRDALALLEEAKSAGGEPDVTLYKTVLRCCWRARQWRSVLALYGDMMHAGLKVDESAYRQFMDALVSAGQTDLAAELLQDMAARGVRPSDGTLGVYLRGFYEVGKYDEAWQRLEEIVRWDGHEFGVAPGPAALMEALVVCTKKEEWGEVLRLDERARKLGDGRVPHQFKAGVVRALVELDRWYDALSLVGELETQGEVDEDSLLKTYSALLKFCSRRIEPKHALELLKRMRVHGVEPDVDCYHWAMDTCAQAGMTLEVRALFEEMSANPRLKPRIESFAVMLELCAREGDKCWEAVRLMGELEALGLEPDVVCWTAAMDSCRDAALEEAMNGTRSKGILTAHMRRWRSMENTQAYNTELAVLACRKGGCPSSALRLLKEMQYNSIPRNADTFNMALEACSRADKLDACLDVYAAMQGEKVQADVFTLLTMGTALVRGGRDDEGLDVLNQLPSALSARGCRTRWPPYYQVIWPSTSKALTKAMLRLAQTRPQRGREIGLIVRSLASRLSDKVDAEQIAEQLVSRRLCTGHVDSVTGGVFANNSDTVRQAQVFQ